MKHLKEKKYSDTEKIDALKNMGYSDDIAKKIMENLRDKNGGEFNKNDRELVAAFKSVAWWWASGSTGTSGWFNATRQGTSDKVTINLKWTSVEVTHKSWTKDITIPNIDDALKNKKNVIKEKDFIDSLMIGGHLSEDAVKQLVKEIRKKNNDFFIN